MLLLQGSNVKTIKHLKKESVKFNRVVTFIISA